MEISSLSPATHPVRSQSKDSGSGTHCLYDLCYGFVVFTFKSRKNGDVQLDLATSCIFHSLLHITHWGGGGGRGGRKKGMLTCSTCYSSWYLKSFQFSFAPMWGKACIDQSQKQTALLRLTSISLNTSIRPNESELVEKLTAAET